jgi:hypothetical protein
MSEALEFVASAVFIGFGATVVMDLWALLLKRGFGVQGLDYAWVGRWIGHMARGRFAHAHIGKAEPVAGERALGWVVHYATGIAFAVALIGFFGLSFTRDPTPLPALIVGLATIVFPFFVMQPAFGIGIAAAKVPNPTTARLRSLMTHLSFAVGLYL